MSNLVSLKSIIDKLEEEKKIPVGYISFRQAYKANKINEEATKHIQEVKKFSSISYYVDKSHIDKFSEALIKQFN